jgi:hypothetical protein
MCLHLHFTECMCVCVCVYQRSPRQNITSISTSLALAKSKVMTGRMDRLAGPPASRRPQIAHQQIRP